MSHEIELKLSLDPDDVAKVARAAPVRAAVTGRARTRTLVSTYYDTADSRLRGAGVAVRTRRIGRAHYLTVKAGQTGLGGVLVRREWEGRSAAGVPDLTVVADLDLRRVVEIAAAGAPLVPVFTTTMSRTTRALDLGAGTTASLDLDRGSVTTADGREEKVCELEIEIVQGDPARLFEFARELLAVVPFRMSTETKAARGYRLLGGLQPQPVKARGLTLTAGMTVEEALLATLQTCLDQVFANDLPVLANDDPEGVHQMRVGLRRLRSAMTLFRSVVPDDQRVPLVDGVRWLTNELGKSRDADVQDDEIVGPVRARFPDDPAFARLGALLSAARVSGREAARAAVRDERTAHLYLDLSSWVARRLWRDQPVSEHSARLFQPITNLSCELLASRHKKCTKRARDFAALPEAERHELRKDLKKLRYACEFFRSLYGKKRVRAYTDRLAALQDELGYLNDVAVAREYVAGIVSRGATESATGSAVDGADLAYAAGVVLGWHEHALAAHEPATAASVKRFLGAKSFWS